MMTEQTTHVERLYLVVGKPRSLSHVSRVRRENEKPDRLIAIRHETALMPNAVG